MAPVIGDRGSLPKHHLRRFRKGHSRLPWFSLERFRARMAATALERVRWFTAIGDLESAARNREVWQEIASVRERLADRMGRAMAGIERRKTERAWR